MSDAGSVGRVQPARPGDPARVGPYRVIGRLGSGGMGTVHAALDPAGQRVAVKVIHAAQAEDPEFRARFHREVVLSSRVCGPCLLPLLAADPDAAAPWLATEYAPGPTLNQHLAGHGPLAGGSLYAFATGTAQALAAIHQAGVVHRDMKPQNVILTPAGPKVLDFGIAHAADGTSVTRTGVMTGTPGWICPEHYRSGTAGPAGDMFVWGALVAYAATGRLPFGTGAPDVVAFRVMSQAPDLEGVPQGLRETLEKALAKEPDERLTATEAAEECSQLLASQATQVLSSEAAMESTLVGDLIGAEWDMPVLDDPTWHTPPARSRTRLYATVATAAVVVGGVTGAFLALMPAETGSTSGHKSPKSSQGRTTAPAPGSTGAPAAANKGDAKIKDDPLPAYTREGRGGEPRFEEWEAARGPAVTAEKGAASAIKDRTEALLADDGMTEATVDITYNHAAQTVFVTSDPQPLWGDSAHDTFLQNAEKAACQELSERLGLNPGGWSYGRYAIYWRELMTPATSDTIHVLGYGDAAGGCEGLEGREYSWQPDTEGLERAQTPSTSRDEIRVADETVNRLFSEWNGNSRLVNDPNYISHSDTSIGFDSFKSVMYVWARKPEWDQHTRSRWAEAAATVACDTITTEAGARKEWAYSQYAVAIRGSDGRATFLRWGSGSSCLE
ncbi:serine/threonine protein kinase [Streptomyces sp. ISL-96]|uniref:serine/threonine protein kinase n=1 Tax=Streptomyces sp. ISL-96 TaxID=2819191 RepID=UPI001BEA29DD|nr:serine/threonine-protein kinase [Streptomyces sp. ISL-96]MBT2487176.1 serine/threonine protein kinase [Streptomyces sp. ISL-96]